MSIEECNGELSIEDLENVFGGVSAIVSVESEIKRLEEMLNDSSISDKSRQEILSTLMNLNNVKDQLLNCDDKKVHMR